MLRVFPLSAVPIDPLALGHELRVNDLTRKASDVSPFNNAIEAGGDCGLGRARCDWPWLEHVRLGLDPNSPTDGPCRHLLQARLVIREVVGDLQRRLQWHLQTDVATDRSQPERHHQGVGVQKRAYEYPRDRSIRFGTVGSQSITYSGSVSGPSMSGNWKILAGGKSMGGGSWSASKSS